MSLNHILTLFRRTSTRLYGILKKNVIKSLLYRPKSLGGLGLPDLWRYYLAARLTQTAQWYAPALGIPWLMFELTLCFRIISLVYYGPNLYDRVSQPLSIV